MNYYKYTFFFSIFIILALFNLILLCYQHLSSSIKSNPFLNGSILLLSTDNITITNVSQPENKSENIDDLSFFKYSNESSSSFYALQSYKFNRDLDRFYDEPIKEALSKVTLDQLLDEDSQIFLNDKTREIIKAVGIEEYKNQTHRLPIHREKDKYLLVLAVSIILGDTPSRQLVQMAALRGMKYLEKYYPIKFVIFENNDKVLDLVRRMNLEYCSEYEVNKFNVAVFQPMIKYLESHYNSEFYGYMNGDIVMSSQIYDVLTTLLEMRDNHTITDQIYVTGKRINMPFNEYYLIRKYLKYYDLVIAYAYRSHQADSAQAMDYFIGTRGLLTSVPMKPVVIGRYYIDGYVTLYVTTILSNVTSIDIGEACISLDSLENILVNNIHLQDNNKHKLNQIEEDNMYNFDLYYETYKTRHGASTNDMKYLLEVGKNLEYKLRLNTNLPKVLYELGPRSWISPELVEQRKMKKKKKTN